MTNTREKMYETNTIIRKFLLQNGFKDLYFFPHLRFSKDYIFNELAFDGIGWKNNEKEVYLFQFKTNEKPSKKLLQQYKLVEKMFFCKCRWVTRFKGSNVQMFGEDTKSI